MRFPVQCMKAIIGPVRYRYMLYPFHDRNAGHEVMRGSGHLFWFIFCGLKWPVRWPGQIERILPNPPRQNDFLALLYG